MTGKQLLFAALRNEKTHRTPWVPFVGVHGGWLMGVTAEEYLKSSDLIVKGLKKSVELYQPDGLPIVFDLQLEAEILGCELQWAEKTPPAVTSHPLAGKPIDDMPSFDITQGRFPLVFDALRTIKADLGEEIGLYGLLTGPFTLALHLLGNEIFLKMRRDPDFVKAVIGRCTEIGKTVAKAYLENGADIIAVVDPMTSQISPKHFTEFVLPAVDDLFADIREQGGFSSMFVCGDATRNMELMCQSKCDNVSIDENVPLELAKELGEKYGRSFGGNLKLTTALLLGTADDAKRDTLRCLDVGGDTGFILAPGCDLPFATPIENLQAVTQLVFDEYQRDVARTTLQAEVEMNFDDIVIPNYDESDATILDIVTLDSASCAPCQYMVDAAKKAAVAFGDQVIVAEHKITEREGLAYMTRLGVENIPSICINGKPTFASIIPDGDTLNDAIQAVIDEKKK